MAVLTGMYAARARRILMACALGSLLVSVTFAPLADARARRVEAGPVTFAGACATPAAAVTCWAATALIVWYTYSAATGADTPDEVAEALYQDFLEWWDGAGEGSEARQQIEFQYAAHPSYFDPTSDIIAQWSAHVLALNLAGWNIQTVSGSEALITGPYAMGAHVLNDVLASAEWSGTLTATGGCHMTFGTVFRINYAVPAISALTHGSAQNKTRLRFNVYRQSDGSLLAHHGPGTLTKDSFPSSDTLLNDQTAQNDEGHCAYFGIPIRVVVDFLSSANTAYQDYGGFAGLTVLHTESDGSPQHTTTILASAFSPSEAAVTLAGEGSGRVRIPAAGANATVANPEAASVARADGSTGPLVDESATTGVGTGDLVEEEERPWWEGLFGGIRGAINTGNNILQNIYTSVTGIATNVAALPATIAGLFNPAVAWADFVSTGIPNAQSNLSAAMPMCLTAGSSPVLFSGGGDDIEFDVGLPGNTVSVGFGAAPEVAAISYPLSTVIIAVVGFLWVLKVLEEPIFGNDH